MICKFFGAWNWVVKKYFSKFLFRKTKNAKSCGRENDDNRNNCNRAKKLFFHSLLFWEFQENICKISVTYLNWFSTFIFNVIRMYLCNRRTTRLLLKYFQLFFHVVSLPLYVVLQILAYSFLINFKENTSTSNKKNTIVCISVESCKIGQMTKGKGR